MAFEESEDIVDWDWLQNQPKWLQTEILKGKKKPKYKKRIRKEKRDAEKKYRD
jgi:hypothetical protein|tara:strand:- start:2006 stop:2164 length:159 start_codon:yes stop_codon:yes gene_type:complete